MKDRTPAYWQTRVLLAVGFIAMVIVLPLSLEVVTELGTSHGRRSLDSPPPS